MVLVVRKEIHIAIEYSVLLYEKLEKAKEFSCQRHILPLQRVFAHVSCLKDSKQDVSNFSEIDQHKHRLVGRAVYDEFCSSYHPCEAFDL